MKYSSLSGWVTKSMVDMLEFRTVKPKVSMSLRYVMSSLFYEVIVCLDLRFINESINVSLYGFLCLEKLKVETRGKF